MKMYIAIKESIPFSFALVAVAHAVAAAMDKWRGKDEVFDEWMDTSFRKVIVKVTDAEFETLREVPDSITMTESALEGMKTSMIFKPRHEYPKIFKFLRLYK